jgi:pantetheine-phosphate adenylyltransferase
VELAKKAVEDFGNVEIMSYTTLTVNFAQSIGAHVMVRGLRMGSDFELEFEMAMMNKKLAPDLELVCFMTSLQFQFLSSSLLKEVAHLGGRINTWVPAHVEKALLQKFGK